MKSLIKTCYSGYSAITRPVFVRQLLATLSLRSCMLSSNLLSFFHFFECKHSEILSLDQQYSLSLIFSDVLTYSFVWIELFDHFQYSVFKVQIKISGLLYITRTHYASLRSSRMFVEHPLNKLCLHTRLCKHTRVSSNFIAVMLTPYLRGDGEIRTLDPLLARQVLSQLSYTPIKLGIHLLSHTVSSAVPSAA